MTLRRSIVGAIVVMVVVAIVIVATRPGPSDRASNAGALPTSRRETDPAASPTRSEPPLARRVPTQRALPGPAPDARRSATRAAEDEPSASATEGKPLTREDLDRIWERIEEYDAIFDAAYEAALQELGLSEPEIEEARRIDAEATARIAELRARAAAGELVDEAEIEKAVDAVLAERERRLRELLGEERSRRLAWTIGQFVHEVRSAKSSPAP